VGSVVSVTKNDGSLCYTFEDQPVDHDCSERDWTWKDATGQVVATGILGVADGGYATITCAVGGAWTHCEPSGAQPLCCSVSPYGGDACPGGVSSPACTAGSCP
jgi:hypothetical protein